jgi:hypothetical protein
LHRFETDCVLRANSYEGVDADSDKATIMMLTSPDRNQEPLLPVPWAMEMRAISAEEPVHLVQTLTGAILGCGGWVLSRGASDAGTVNLLFEFERRVCVEIYTLLIASGLELSQAGHIRLTELCQCTRSGPAECGREIASIDLEIQTIPGEKARGARPSAAI